MPRYRIQAIGNPEVGYEGSTCPEGAVSRWLHSSARNGFSDKVTRLSVTEVDTEGVPVQAGDVYTLVPPRYCFTVIRRKDGVAIPHATSIEPLKE